MNIEDSRVSKLRSYLFDVINNLTENRNYQINTNMLSNKIDDYSIDKIPVETETEPSWITGTKIKQEVYDFRTRKSYSQDTIVNLNNMGFFEQFENAIETNNDKGILPDIDGIESIECLSPFTINNSEDGKTATFDTQIKISYRKDDINGTI